MRKAWLAGAAAAVLIGTIVLARPADKTSLVLDIQAGEPIGDAMARSSMKADFPIVPDMLGLDMLPETSWIDHNPYQLRLQAGDGKVIALPWTPDGGMIWTEFGVITEIDLDYHDFGKAPSVPESVPAPPASANAPKPDAITRDIEAIVRTYQAFHAVNPRQSDIASCYHNLIPREFLAIDKRDSERKSCKEVLLRAELQSPDQLRDALRQLLETKTDKPAADPMAGPDDAYRVLNLGQWWLPNGNLVRITVVPNYGPGPDWTPTGLSMSINIREFFNAHLSGLVRTCFDQQAIFPDKISYSQTQAATIYHGLYDDFYPPVVDGQPVTDMDRLQQLDWAALSDSYWNDASQREGFCALFKDLERQVGYTGPEAPLR